MTIPDPNWIARCRLWTRLLDLYGTDAEAMNAAETFAGSLDSLYTELATAAYTRGIEVGQEQAGAEVATLRQRVQNLEEQINALTGDPTPEVAPPMIIH